MPDIVLVCQQADIQDIIKPSQPVAEEGDVCRTVRLTGTLGQATKEIT